MVVRAAAFNGSLTKWLGRKVSLDTIASSRLVTATLKRFSTRRVSSLGIDVSLPSDGRPHASTSSAGESFHCGSPSGLKLRVFTKCKP